MSSIDSRIYYLRVQIKIGFILLFPVLAFAALPLVDVEMDGLTARFTTPEAAHIYFVLTESENLMDYSPTGIAVATESMIWESPAPLNVDKWFWVMRTYSVFAAVDSDGDRMDDMYEIARPGILDPINPDDAHLDPDGNGLTHLQEYLLFYFGGEGAAPQFYSHEVSTFNFGAPREKQGSLSREITAFNFGAPLASVEAISRLVSIYNGSGFNPSGIPQVYSRELSAYNFGTPLFSIDALSREFSIYNGEAIASVTSIAQRYSREVSVFNFGAPIYSVEALSREVSVNALTEEQ